jgi:hypothetical protein
MNSLCFHVRTIPDKVAVLPANIMPPVRNPGQDNLAGLSVALAMTFRGNRKKFGGQDEKSVVLTPFGCPCLLSAVGSIVPDPPFDYRKSIWLENCLESSGKAGWSHLAWKGCL